MKAIAIVGICCLLVLAGFLMVDGTTTAVVADADGGVASFDGGGVNPPHQDPCAANPYLPGC